MQKYLELILITTAIILAYIWLQVPLLARFSLQGFAVAILVFFALLFVTKRSRAVASAIRFELIPLVFASIILIGATGGTTSSFFALLYVFLLLLVLNTTLNTSGIVTSELVFVFYALTINLEVRDWLQLLSLPLMMGFFIYSKYQFDISAQQRQALATSTELVETISQQKMTLERFIKSFLKPKLAMLAKLGNDSDTSKQVLLNQLNLLESEIDKVLARPDQMIPQQTTIAQTDSSSANSDSTSA